MKKIYVNLKRFDVPRALGGVNDIADIKNWGAHVIEKVQGSLKQYQEKCSFTFFLPEMHLIPALEKRTGDTIVKIGCQGVYMEDIKEGGNFGAFTTNFPAAAAKAVGCTEVLIGHCEERMKIAKVLREANIQDPDAINRILYQEVKRSIDQGLNVLYCIGETGEELDVWQEVLGKQLSIGLKDIDTSKVTIAYEPVWAIGPGKAAPDQAYITKIARFIKEQRKDIGVVYGGGLKSENAEMLARIPDIDGGLIALTRFKGEIGFYPDEYLEIVALFLNESR